MEQTIGFLEQFPYLTALITFTIGLITMPFVLNFAKSRNMVVRPNKRTSHTGSVPNIGGLNIFASLILIFIIMLAVAANGNFFFRLFNNAPFTA